MKTGNEDEVAAARHAFEASLEAPLDDYNRAIRRGAQSWSDTVVAGKVVEPEALQEAEASGVIETSEMREMKARIALLRSSDQTDQTVAEIKSLVGAYDTASFMVARGLRSRQLVGQALSRAAAIKDAGKLFTGDLAFGNALEEADSLARRLDVDEVYQGLNDHLITVRLLPDRPE